jgi:hypothetical protein
MPIGIPYLNRGTRVFKGKGDWPVVRRCGSCALITDLLVGECIKTREMKGLVY